MESSEAAVMMWASTYRSCRNCNKPIRLALLVDKTRQWRDDGDFMPGVCSAAVVFHQPYDVPAVMDAAALSAWLDA